jgi:hypothetical protein
MYRRAGVDVGFGVGVSVGVSVDIEVGLGRVLFSDEGAGSSEQPTRAIVRSITPALNQLTIDLDI